MLPRTGRSAENEPGTRAVSVRPTHVHNTQAKIPYRVSLANDMHRLTQLGYRHVFVLGVCWWAASSFFWNSMILDRLHHPNGPSDVNETSPLRPSDALRTLGCERWPLRPMIRSWGAYFKFHTISANTVRKKLGTRRGKRPRYASVLVRIRVAIDLIAKASKGGMSMLLVIFITREQPDQSHFSKAPSRSRRYFIPNLAGSRKGGLPLSPRRISLWCAKMGVASPAQRLIRAVSRRIVGEISGNWGVIIVIILCVDGPTQRTM